MAELDGAAAPAQFITAMMGKQKRQALPYNRANIVAPFNPGNLGNPSRDIQVKYLHPPAALRPYDACAARERREEAIEEGKPGADPEAYSLVAFMVRNQIGSVAEAVRRYYEVKEEKCDVMKPEYWGMTWADLQPAGTDKWVNADGLRFPPVQWRDPTTGQMYWGLACCGGAPEEDGKRNRYTMIYFKEGEAPAIDTQFKETAERKRNRRNEAVVPPQLPEFNALLVRDFLRRQEARVARGEVLPAGEQAQLEQYRARVAAFTAAEQQQLAQYDAREAERDRLRREIGSDVKTYRGVRLAGTDRVKARPEEAVEAARGRRGEGPRDRIHNLPTARRKQLLEQARAAITEFKTANPNAGRCAEAPQAAAALAPRGPPGGIPQLQVAELEAPAPALEGPLMVVGELPADEQADANVRRTRAYARLVRSTGRRITRPMIRDAYNATRFGIATFMRIAYALGVPADKDLSAFNRMGIMKAITKYAPFYDINTGASKAFNGDILTYPRPNEIAAGEVVRLQ